ncbi:Uncharacterised protein [Bordetella pertussis]|nr:Uncharacterised protein [Bordetella pertussis]CPL87022.1 Uncharacterised protein [Bordetella pertussis]CPN91912.1 Uncharacterised protein [Bordetella pertussis]CPO12294.1 Uncharacterised protein [Bordetella pertussis]CPO92368.1 Uncharacterised protein [Bordetella pertussis]
MSSISLPPGSKNMMPGGPNRRKRLSKARSSALFLVTSACTSSICDMRAATVGSLKVKCSISRHDTHQSA